MSTIIEAEEAMKAIRSRFGRQVGIKGIGLTWDEAGNAWVRMNVDAGAYDEVERGVSALGGDVRVELRRVDDVRLFHQTA